MNRYPLWKYMMVLFITILGFMFALPNLYAPDPAVQISGQSGSQVIDQAVVDRAVLGLEQAGIVVKSTELTNTNGLIRLSQMDDQLPAKKAIQKTLGLDYVVALNLAPTTPQWLANMGAEPMKLGLDLSGGVHFLLQVDTEEAVNKRLKTTITEIKSNLRKEKARYKSIVVNGAGQVEAKFSDAELRDKANSVIRSSFPDLVRRVEDRDDGFFYIFASMSDSKVREIEDYAVSQNLVALRNRVNELGVSEPLVQRQGRNRIVVELPGVQDTAAAKRIIGKTANLEFRLEAKPEALSSFTEKFNFRNEADSGRFGAATIEKKLILTGDHVSNAQSSFDSQTSQPQVNISLDSLGGQKMNRATRNNIGRRMAVLFIETKSHLKEDGTVAKKVEKSIISLATVQAALGVQFRITGLDNPAEASELALLLRAGALAAPMFFVEERTIGPSLGAENIELGVTSVQYGMLVVVLFMLLYYKAFGVAANIALSINLLLLVAVMSVFGATLTLPGIAGIVLTVGMAVDANVLIFSRIKEELKEGASPQTAINAGYDRAFTTILDANITTLIVALILFAIGSGPVQGFAITLSIGILTSMFTAITGTRALVNLVVGGRPIKKLWI